MSLRFSFNAVYNAAGREPRQFEFERGTRGALGIDAPETAAEARDRRAERSWTRVLHRRRLEQCGANQCTELVYGYDAAQARFQVESISR
jgi:hypothetical protein